jgi:hypothetical protein
MKIAPLLPSVHALASTFVHVPVLPDLVPARASAPIVDFPGISAGMRFEIVDGSKAGPIGIRGNAVINELTDDRASFHVAAGRFGMKVDVTVDVERTGPDSVRLHSSGRGLPDTVADGRIVAQRTNYVEFARIDAPDERTIITHDGRGGVTIETVVPTIGRVYLNLKRDA